jgi:hypothetical protein
MAPRIMTLRGLRTLDRTVALPRETQAAAKTIQAVGSKLEKLPAGSPSLAPAVISDVLSEGFADAMASMAIKRDPHVSMMGIMYWLSATSGCNLNSANFFDHQAAGAADSGNAGVWHNLLDDRQPLKPCLAHSIGISAHLRCVGPSYREVEIIHAIRVTLQRNKEDLFEFPLSHALVGLTLNDSEGLELPQFDIEPLSGGGIEIEGHGAPFLMDEAIGLKVDFPAGAALEVSTTGGLFMLTARVDGEVMEV